MILVPVVWKRQRLLAHDSWSRERLLAYQQRELARLRAYAYARSPFYRRFHRGLEDRPLQDLPVLTKARMLEEFDDLVTDPAIRLSQVLEHLETLRGNARYLERYWVNATSGSTGRRGVYLFDDGEWSTVLAGFARSTSWAGLHAGLTHRVKQASIASTAPGHMSARAAASVSSVWVPTLRMDASEPLDRVVSALNDWQPEFLVAYASMAQELAEEQLAGRLHVTPEAVFASSEVLTAEMRRRIEAAWGQRLFEQYAATESGMLAAECSCHRGMHVVEDLVILEVVDEDNRPVPPGVFGAKVLLTVLFNRTQPLIRFELSDRVRLKAGMCACDRPYVLIDGIEGRAEDLIRLPGAGGRVVIHPNVFHRLLEAVGAAEWQVVQEADGLRVILVGVPAPFDSESLRRRIVRVLVDMGAYEPAVRLEHARAIPKAASGKAPLIRALR